jgi:hypothetical protein
MFLPLKLILIRVRVEILPTMLQSTIPGKKPAPYAPCPRCPWPDSHAAESNIHASCNDHLPLRLPWILPHNDSSKVTIPPPPSKNPPSLPSPVIHYRSVTAPSPGHWLQSLSLSQCPLPHLLPYSPTPSPDSASSQCPAFALRSLTCSHCHVIIDLESLPHSHWPAVPAT